MSTIAASMEAFRAAWLCPANWSYTEKVESKSGNTYFLVIYDRSAVRRDFMIVTRDGISQEFMEAINDFMLPSSLTAEELPSNFV